MPAAIIPAVIGGATAIYGAKKSADAAKAGANASQKATDATIAEQKRQFDLTRSDQLPWLTAGTGALADLTALNTGDYSKFYESPDYKFTYDQGMKGLDRSAASRGRLYSGGYGQDLVNYAQGAASTQYNNFYNKKASIAGVGQTTAAGLGGLGANYANSMGTALQNNATNRTSAYNSQANAWGNAANQIGGIAGNYFGSKVTPTSGYVAPSSPYALPDLSNNSWYTGVGSSGWGG